MGLVPGQGGTVSLPRRIGARARPGSPCPVRPSTPPTALEWGLVDEIEAGPPPT